VRQAVGPTARGPVSGTLHRLGGLVGRGVARELALTGRTLTADRALALGLVTQVVLWWTSPRLTGAVCRWDMQQHTISRKPYMPRIDASLFFIPFGIFRPNPDPPLPHLPISTVRFYYVTLTGFFSMAGLFVFASISFAFQIRNSKKTMCSAFYSKNINHKADRAPCLSQTAFT